MHEDNVLILVLSIYIIYDNGICLIALQLSLALVYTKEKVLKAFIINKVPCDSKITTSSGLSVILLYSAAVDSNGYIKKWAIDFHATVLAELTTNTLND